MTLPTPLAALIQQWRDEAAGIKNPDRRDDLLERADSVERTIAALPSSPLLAVIERLQSVAYHWVKLSHWTSLEDHNRPAPPEGHDGQFEDCSHEDCRLIHTKFPALLPPAQGWEPKRRCETCDWWLPWKHDKGNCEIDSLLVEYEVLLTHKDFGCVEWKAAPPLPVDRETP